MTDKRIYKLLGNDKKIITSCFECGWYSDWYWQFGGPACLWKSKPRSINRPLNPRIDPLCPLDKVKDEGN